MNYYFAPMEGLTDAIYRQVHHRYFPGLHRYYMPFLSPTIHRKLTAKEQRELPPADSCSFTAIPQILTKDAGDFLWAATVCRDLGYGEINLNLGCPSGTVVAKGKGAGMLRDPDALAAFLDEIFAHCPLPISIKTRLGLESPQEFPKILEILNRYPLRELILHPRVRSDFYRGGIHMEAFQYCCAHSRAPVCYNGDLFSLEAIADFCKQFSQVPALMLGRGLIADPGMLTPGGTTREALEAMYDTLLEEYLQAFGGSRNAMFRLKENWYYLISLFENGERLYKRLRKTTDLVEYRAITREIFQTLPLHSGQPKHWQ